MSGGIDFRGHAQYPAFLLPTLFLLLALQKWQEGLFLSFCIFCPEFIPVAPLVPYAFLYFVTEERFIQVHALQQRAPGPSLSQLYFELSTEADYLISPSSGFFICDIMIPKLSRTVVMIK